MTEAQETDQARRNRRIAGTAFDYVTIIQINGPCSKTVTIESDGSYTKKASKNIARGTASTYHVPTAREMADVLREVSDRDDQLIVLGFVKGNKPSPGDTEAIRERRSPAAVRISVSRSCALVAAQRSREFHRIAKVTNHVRRLAARTRR